MSSNRLTQLELHMCRNNYNTGLDGSPFYISISEVSAAIISFDLIDLLLLFHGYNNLLAPSHFHFLKEDQFPFTLSPFKMSSFRNNPTILFFAVLPILNKNSRGNTIKSVMTFTISTIPNLAMRGGAKISAVQNPLLSFGFFTVFSSMLALSLSLLMPPLLFHHPSHLSFSIESSVKMR